MVKKTGRIIAAGLVLALFVCLTTGCAKNTAGSTPDKPQISGDDAVTDTYKSDGEFSLNCLKSGTFNPFTAENTANLICTQLMTQIFDEAGKVVPVTVIEAGPCVVVQKRTADKEGYTSVQFGFEDQTGRKLSKPEKGHLEKSGVSLKKYLKEFRLEDCASLNVGDVVSAGVFAEGDKVDVTGISKGKGYQGVIKRWNAQRTPTSHGGGPVHRHAGSMRMGVKGIKVMCAGRLGGAEIARSECYHG